MLNDASIDDLHVEIDGARLAVKDALAAILALPPTVANARRAARLFVRPSPALLKSTARWFAVLDALEQSGQSATERLRILMRTTSGAFKEEVYPPAKMALLQALAAVDDETLTAAAEAFADLSDPLPHGETAALALVRRGELPERFDRLVVLDLEWPYGRELLEALPEPRRQTRLKAFLAPLSNRYLAVTQAKHALMFVDLMGDEARTLLDDRVDELAASHDPQKNPFEWTPDEWRARVERGLEIDEDHVRGEDDLSEQTRRVLQRVVDKLAEEPPVDELGPLAEHRRELSIRVDAPQLRELAEWRDLTEERQVEIGRAVADSANEGGFGLTFAGLAVFDDFAVAELEHQETGMRFSLVPGGTYLRGLSEREEELVRAAGEADPDAGNWYETYQYLIDQAPTMRPVAEVRVAPFLVAQHPSDACEPSDVIAMVEELPFRLLTEAEHEWAQRAGRHSQLTWRGDEIPTEAWLEEVRDAGDDLRNPFGLVGLGLLPEVLCDVFVPGYEDAPTDGSARTGEGPRVVRGGALMVYPWQACGEWQLLMNAVRSSADGWEFFHSIRPAVGIRID